MRSLKRKLSSDEDTGGEEGETPERVSWKEERAIPGLAKCESEGEEGEIERKRGRSRSREKRRKSKEKRDPFLSTSFNIQIYK